ncbi:TPA: DUF551 domain-containing protein [Klebsiella variicola]
MQLEALIRQSLAAMDSESGCLPLDYLQGHKDGLEWASQLAEANHPETGDWLYDDPIELAKAIRKGPDMPPAQPAADSEPVAWTWQHLKQWHVTNDEERARDLAWDGVKVEPLYRRAAMLQAGTLTNEGTKQAWTGIPDIDNAINMLDRIDTLESCDDDRIEAVKTVLRGLAGNSQVIPDGYVMVPDDLKEAAADLLATLDDYPEQLVPINRDSSVVRALRAAMLAAAPQSPGSEPATVPGKWIPVSERMPEDDDFVYIWPRPDFGVELHVGQYCECSPKGDGWYAQVYEQNYGIEWHPITVTHWMPLPAAPQEVKGE